MGGLEGRGEIKRINLQNKYNDKNHVLPIHHLKRFKCRKTFELPFYKRHPKRNMV